jgi:O-antigen/teichoic acid export membrane protein
MLIGQSRLFKNFISLVLAMKSKVLREQRKNLSELLWLLFGQLVTLLLSLISIKYITSIGPKDYGVFILLTSITAICIAVYFGPYEQAYVRFLFEFSDTEIKRRLFLQRFLWGIFKSISYTVAIFLLLLAISKQLAFQKEYLSLIALAVIVLPLVNQPLTGMLNALRLRREVAIIQIAEKALQVCILLVYVFFSTLHFTEVLWAIGTTFFCFMLVRLYILRLHSFRLPRERIDAPTVLPLQMNKEIAHYMGPFVIWGIFSGLQGNGERWIVQSVLSTSDVGRYGLAFSLISATVIMTYNILSQYFTPLIFESFSAKNESDHSHGRKMIAIFRWVVVLTVVIFALTYGICGNVIINLVSTKEYHVGGWFLFTLTMGIGLFYIAQVETIVGLSLRQSNIYLIPKILASTFSIIVYFIGCSYAGLLGTSAAVFLVNFGYLLSVILLNRRLTMKAGQKHKLFA